LSKIKEDAIIDAIVQSLIEQNVRHFLLDWFIAFGPFTIVKLSEENVLHLDIGILLPI